MEALAALLSLNKSKPKIELYAELLTHIRTVTLVASLKTATNSETRIDLLSDNQTITISHDGISASLRLPTRMVGGGTAAITLPPRPCKDLTLRLKVEETEPGLLSFEHSDENLVPWPAVGMESVKAVGCWRCGTSLIKVRAKPDRPEEHEKGGEVENGEDKSCDGLTEWRDLPSENWAEMMDFWHCHKPHEHGENGHGDPNAATESKGYASSSKLAAKKGTGFLSLVYFVVSEEDCENIKVKEAADVSTLHCTSCDLQLGTVDPIVEGWKLYKWSLSITKDDSTVEKFSVPKWISTQLLATVDHSGVRRFVVEPSDRKDGQTDGLLCWLFTDSLSFSSSHLFFMRNDPTRAMKILFKPVEDAAKIMDEQHFSHEHLIFPPHVYTALKSTLETSQFLLPQSARKFQDWNVGLLQRFSWEDVSGSDATVIPGPKGPEVRYDNTAPGRQQQAESSSDEEDAREAIKKIYGSEALLE